MCNDAALISQAFLIDKQSRLNKFVPGHDMKWDIASSFETNGELGWLLENGEAVAKLNPRELKVQYQKVRDITTDNYIEESLSENAETRAYFYSLQ